MRKTHAVFVVALALALYGCGGGGGGGTPPPAGGNPPPSPPPTPPPPPPPPTSTGGSSAAIVFPWQRSSAVGSTVVVRGTATDPDGVAAVRVNGLGATLSALPSTNKPSAAQRKPALAAPMAVALEADGATEVAFSVEVELAPGETELVVEVEDATGAETEGAAEATIKYAEVPTLFTSEVGDPRLVGWSTSLERTAGGTVTRLVSFDMESREQTIYPELTDIGIASCFRSQLDELLYVVGAVEVWHVRSFNLATRVRSDVADLGPLLTAEPGFEGPHLIDIVCSSSQTGAYLLASYVENGSFAKSRVIEVPLGVSPHVLSETDPNENPRWLAYGITLAGDRLITMREINSVAPLTSISLENGTRTESAPIDVGGLAIVAAPDQERVWVSTFAGVDEVVLTEPPTKANISPATPTEPLVFSQANSIGLDLLNDRVIVGDSDLDAVIAVDRITGQRSELVSRKIGDGPPLISPRRLALTADGSKVYVADDGGNASEKLFEIDLTTGDRRVLGQIHDVGVNRSIPGLALDEENGYAYVARFDRGTILRVDLETEGVEAITSDDDGLLDGILDIVLDAPAQRLLVADAVTESIVAVDVVTLQKELLSRAGQQGDGPAFDTLVSLALSPDGTTVYAADQATDQILRVNLESGDREVFDTGCAIGSNQGLRQIVYDPAADELLIAWSNGIFAHDFETGQCASIPLPISFLPLGIALTPDGRILAAGFNAVTQVDRASGDIVIVSK